MVVVVLTLLELNWEMGNKSCFWSILEGGYWVTSRGYWCTLKIPKKGGKLHETVANCIVITRGEGRITFSDTLARQAHVQLSIK